MLGVTVEDICRGEKEAESQHKEGLGQDDKREHEDGWCEFDGEGKDQGKEHNQGQELWQNQKEEEISWHMAAGSVIAQRR